MYFLMLLLARPSTGTDVQSDGVCNLGDDMCYRSPRALLQTGARIGPVRYSLAALDSVVSDDNSVISTDVAIGYGIGNTVPLDDAGYQTVANLCCWREMKEFVQEVAKKEFGFEFCAEGGLMGLLWWFDCTDDKQNYSTLVETIRQNGPDEKTGHKGDCPFLGWRGCKNFPEHRNCTKFSGHPPECKPLVTTSPEPFTTTSKEPTTITNPLPTTVSTTTSSTTMCPETNWDNDVFAACDFWGDPHWTATFHAGRYPNSNGRRWDFYGNGIFELASSKDGSFRMQSFQCKVAKRPKVHPAVTVALVMKMDGQTVFISNQDIDFDGSPGSTQAVSAMNTLKGYSEMSQNKCVRWNVRTKLRIQKGKGKGAGKSLTPPWVHGVKLRIHKDMVADAGLCGKKDPPHELVPNGQVLFSQAQIDEICKVCTIDPPLHCSQGGVPNGVPAEEVTMSEREQAEEACKSAVPPIAISDAQEKCMSSVDINACITDYCATDGDDTMVEIANEEKNHLVPGSAAIVQCTGCFGNSEGPCKQTNNNVCHAFSVPAERICPPGTTKCSATKYVLKSSGTCAPQERILDDTECMEAAKSLEKQDKDNKIEGNDNGIEGRPYGCTWHKFGNVEMWGKDKGAECGSLNYNCICKVLK